MCSYKNNATYVLWYLHQSLRWLMIWPWYAVDVIKLKQLFYNFIFVIYLIHKEASNVYIYTNCLYQIKMFNCSLLVDIIKFLKRYMPRWKKTINDCVYVYFYMLQGNFVRGLFGLLFFDLVGLFALKKTTN